MWQFLKRQSLAPATGGVRLTQRRVYILPTRQGWGFALLLLTMQLAAINYNNNLSYILCFLLAGIALVSSVHAVRNLVGLRIEAGRSVPVFSGETAYLAIRIRNFARRPRCAVIVGLCDGTVLRCEVPAAGEYLAAVPVVTTRRGWLTPPRVVLATVFPLGLFRAWASVALPDCKVLVYPRPVAPGLRYPEGPGMRPGASQRHYVEEEFHRLREYQPGDSPKIVHWRAVAKGQGLLTREFRQEHNEELWLEYCRAPGATVEIRLAQLCRWVLDAEHSQRRYGLRLPGVAELPLGRGAGHLAECLAQLAVFG